jgi:hypothetical protein
MLELGMLIFPEWLVAKKEDANTSSPASLNNPFPFKSTQIAKC